MEKGHPLGDGSLGEEARDVEQSEGGEVEGGE